MINNIIHYLLKNFVSWRKKFMEKRQRVSFCFLILHYIDIELTCKTVDSILGLQNFDNSQIVIVDNASPNESGKLLKNKYKEIKQIHIILSNENIGFSAGNNLGFQYIKNNFMTEFVIATNCDVLFLQKDFINKVKELYLEDPFWVAGPDIFVPNRNYHSSPLSDRLIDSKTIDNLLGKWEWERRKFQKKISLYGIVLYIKDCYAKNIIVKNIFKIKWFIQGKKKKYDKRSDKVVLQGSCLIFDKRYCEENEELFRPLTFMYAEEDILAYQCMSHNWKIRYFPEIQVYHLCEGSSQLYKLNYQQYCKKRLLKLDRLQESYRILNQLVMDSEM